MRRLPPFGLDTSIPVLLAKMRGHPLHYGGLALARSVGECGVPVVALVEDRRTPLAQSRFVTHGAAGPGTGRGPGGDRPPLVTGRVGCQRPPLTVPTDDEMAVFLDDHQAELRDGLILNNSPRGTARRLSDKGSLHTLAKAVRRRHAAQRVARRPPPGSRSSRARCLSRSSSSTPSRSHGSPHLEQPDPRWPPTCQNYLSGPAP